MTANLLAPVLTAASAALLGWRWRAAIRGWRWPHCLTAGILLVAIFTAWRLAVAAVIGTLASDWNGSRLAPTFALRYGYQLYYPAQQGPITNHVYGPLAAFAYLPATFFRVPTPAILAGGALQVAFVFGAMLIFVWRAGARDAADRALALACGVAACLLMARYRGTAYWFTMVHADGPSLALGLLACTALVSRDGAPPSTPALLASALAAVLSCWAKQTAAPLPLALALAVWIAHGRAVALRYAVMLAAIGALVSAAFVGWFGRPMLFNMLEIVSRHGWIKPGLAGLATTIGRFLAGLWEVLALLAVGLVAVRLAPRGAARRTAGAWLAPALAALLLLPTGALGANKLGGEPSSFHSAYYLIAAAAAAFAEAGRAAAARLLGWSFCVLAIAAAWQSGRATLPASRPPLWENSQQVAYEFALRHPGETYFPWQPLATLLAEGRLYHFEYGMIDRYIAGYGPTPAHLQANLPPHLHWVAATARVWSMNEFFSDYSEEAPFPDLPGFIVLSRPQRP
jgi:hypothetical protein